MALVDYMGFRLQALSLLPIKRDTIIYGSADGGMTVYNNNKRFARLMKLAGEKLNLAPHSVGFPNSSPTLLYSCAGIYIIQNKIFKINY